MPQSLRLPALRPRTELMRAVDTGTIVAAAQAYTPNEWRNAQVFGGNNPWENEAWGFWDTLGEFYQAVDWQARAMSRIRLGAAEVVPGGDEPEMLTDGPAADLMDQFCGGTPGHSAFLKSISPQLLVPGQGWLIAERDDPRQPLATADWGVYSMDCVQGMGSAFQVRVGPGTWRYLAPDNLPMRIYQPHPRWSWLATSSAQAALPIMRRIHLIDSRIVAMMVSRLAMNGLLLIPQEGTFAVPPQYKDAPDPFVAMLIDIASRNIANPGQASAGIPIPIKFTGELIDKWRLLKQDDPLDEWLLKERTDELGRLGDTLGIARERVTGGLGQSNHWCVDDKTEILTTAGWRTHDQLVAGDIALTLNHETGLSEWQPVEAVNRWQVADEPMVEIERGNHSSLTTMNHRWPVLRARQRAGLAASAREWALSSELGYAHRVVTAAPSADVPAEAKHLDDLVELVAWFWTEGNISPSNSVTIAQSHTRNPARVARIRGALTRLLGEATQSRVRPAVPEWRESVQLNRSSFGGPVTIFRISQAAATGLIAAAPNKRVSLDFIRELTRAQLELFIDVSCQGDGWHYRKGMLDIWQREPAALEAYELAVILSGRMVTHGQHGSGYVVTPWTQSTVRPMKSLNGTHPQVVISYSGTIWCPTTPNRTWLARRNGTVYFTGNSAWQVSEEEVNLAFAPMAEVICGAVTKAYLVSLLKALGQSLVGPRGGKLIAWYDTSELTARPDNSANIRQAYIDGVVNEDAYRREIGAGEADVPTDEEVEVWAFKRMVTAGTADAAAGLAGLRGEETPAAGAALMPAASGMATSGGPPPAVQAPAAGLPPTRATPPPAPTGPPAMAASALRPPPRRHNGITVARR